TGSTATGKQVMASAAGTIKRLTLELGGNDAAIVLEDADPKEVAPKIYAAATVMSGQACIAIKRLYVHASIYDAVCDELGRLARETVVGDGPAGGERGRGVRRPGHRPGRPGRRPGPAAGRGVAGAGRRGRNPTRGAGLRLAALAPPDVRAFPRARDVGFRGAGAAPVPGCGGHQFRPGLCRRAGR